MTLSELLTQQFKVKTRAIANPLVSAVGTSAVRVLSNNPNRLAWIIINLSTNSLYLAFDNTVSTSRGIYVGPNGGYATLVWDEDFDLVGWELYAVASGAGSNIYVVEIVTAE